MATPPFSHFQWLHPQPFGCKPKFQLLNDDLVQSQATEIVERRVLRWQGFRPDEVIRLSRFKERVIEARKG